MPLGELPAHLRSIVAPVAGLSRLGTKVGAHLLGVTPVDESFIRAVLNTELATALELTPTEVNDAVDELVTNGLAETNNELGTAPFEFRFVEATYLLYHAFAVALPYKPADDVKAVLSSIAALAKRRDRRCKHSPAFRRAASTRPSTTSRITVTQTFYWRSGPLHSHFYWPPPLA